MSIKAKLTTLIVRQIKNIIGLNKGLKVSKQLLYRLQPKYAFPITWLCLDEFPLDTATEEEYSYGSVRGFPHINVKVNPKCLHARFFVLSGYYEEDLTKEILSPNRKGLLIDIGANFGYYPILWLQKEDSRVIAVEPVDEYVEILKENLAIYESRYAIEKSCIGDRDGVAFLDTFGDPTMLTKVVADNREGATRRVEMLTITSLLNKYNETNIDVLKIDAEGYDINILEACKPLFEAKAIKTVFWETANSPEEKDITEFLEKLGYCKILDKGTTGYELPVR